MIHTRNLTKTIQSGSTEHALLQNINLDINKGDFVALHGPSGSGKSNLLGILGLIDKATSGDLLFLNQDVTHLSDRQRQRLQRGNIGFVFEDFGLLDELTVYENIELPLRYLRFNKRTRATKITAALNRLNIGHLKQFFPSELSHIHKQLVGICRAYVISPELIIADEPTGFLSSEAGNTIMDVLSSLNEEGQTILLATHSTRVASKAQRIISLFDGHIITDNSKTAW